MKDKRIMQAANKYVGHEPKADEGIYISVKREGFIDGAKWFNNAIWHDASEVPDREPCSIIIEYDDDYIGMNYEFENDPGLGTWNDFFKRMNVIHWCYLFDILLKGGK